MIQPLAGLRDWFLLPEETARPLLGLPGLKPGRVGHFQAHVSLLTLLGTPEAMQWLPDRRSSLLRQQGISDVWAIRDQRTAALGFKLRTTQQQAIDFFEPRRGMLLGDDMRLGKTLSAIMCHDPARGPLVIVAPLSTRGVWLGWLKRVFPELADQIGCLTGRKFDAVRASQPIVFVHYDIVHGWQSTKKIGTLVLDEAHLVTNKDAKRSEAVALLARFAERVIAMTGTPIWDLPPDLWNVVGMVAPGAWGSHWDFSLRYGLPVPSAYGTRFTGLSNGEELRMRLSEVMLRRRWVDCADDLPAVTRSVVVAEVNDAQHKKLDILAGKLKSERANTAANLAAYRQAIVGIKASAVYREAEKITSRGEPVVVWTWHRNFASELASKLENGFMISGDIAPDKREEILDAWRTCPTGVLVATMAVAQVGIDLSHARIAIFAEIDYTPAIIGQAEMRTYDPKRPMDVLFVVADHLVDQRIVRALVNKLSAANPLGVGAAVDSIEALRDAVLGQEQVGDLDRLLEDFLASSA